MKNLLLKTGDYYVGKEKDSLTTRGIGSCVVICFFEKTKKISAMAHMLLPNQNGILIYDKKIGLSPETAIPQIVEEIIALGGDISLLEISLIGAGNMFPEIKSGHLSNIGLSILQATKFEIKHIIPVKFFEDTGGSFGRSVSLNCTSGVIEVLNTNGDTIIN